MIHIVLTTPNGSWEIVPVSTMAGVPVLVITAYILFRAVLFIDAMRDVYSGVPMRSIMFPWRSGWEPDKSRLIKPVVHCIIGGVLLAVYITVGGHFGWLEFVEQQWPLDKLAKNCSRFLSYKKGDFVRTVALQE